MVLDFVHYRLYKEVKTYAEVIIGCEAYFLMKERQLLDMLLLHKKKLNTKDKQLLKKLLKKHKGK